MLQLLNAPDVVNCGISLPRECLAFRLGEKEYAVDFELVQELRAYDAVLPLPDTPAFVLGVVNVRGLIIPVIDLCLKFQCKNDMCDKGAVLVILNMDDQLLGLLVNDVTEVIATEHVSARPPLSFLWRSAANYLSGVAVMQRRKVPVLDVERLLAMPELRGLSQRCR